MSNPTTGDEPKWHDGTIREQLAKCEQQLAAERELRNKLDAVERDKRDFEMFRNIIPAGEPTPDNPTTTGEWTAMCLAKFYAAGRLQEQQLCDAINAALAAEREKTVLATQMVHIESKRANEAVEALKEIATAVKASDEMLRAKAVAALAKYPLPDGRTK